MAGTLKGGSGSRGWPDPSDGNGGGLVCGTVSSKWAKGTGGPAGDECQNLVTDPIAYNVTFNDANGGRKDRPDGGLYVTRAEAAKTLTSNGELSTYIAFSAKDYGADAAENAPTLRAMGHDASHANGGGRIAVAIPLQEIGKRTGKSTDDASIGMGIGTDGDAMYTLQAAARHGVAYDTRSGMAPHGSMKGETISPTLRAKEHEPPMVMQDAVASFKPGQSADSRGIGYENELAPSLEAGGGGNNRPAIMQHMAVPVMR